MAVWVGPPCVGMENCPGRHPCRARLPGIRSLPYQLQTPTHQWFRLWVTSSSLRSHPSGQPGRDSSAAARKDHLLLDLSKIIRGIDHQQGSRAPRLQAISPICSTNQPEVISTTTSDLLGNQGTHPCTSHENLLLTTLCSNSCWVRGTSGRRAVMSVGALTSVQA